MRSDLRTSRASNSCSRSLPDDLHPAARDDDADRPLERAPAVEIAGFDDTHTPTSTLKKSPSSWLLAPTGASDGFMWCTGLPPTIIEKFARRSRKVWMKAHGIRSPAEQAMAITLPK